MGCGHWLAESPRGITLQIYLALIGALLLQLDLGRRASRRVWELLQWHQIGMMDDAEPAAQLTAQLDGEEQALAKKQKPPRTEHRCCPPHAVPGHSLPKKDTHKRATPPRRAPTRTPSTAVCKPNFAARGTPDIFGFQPANPAGWEASVPSEPRRTN